MSRFYDGNILHEDIYTASANLQVPSLSELSHALGGGGEKNKGGWDADEDEDGMSFWGLVPASTVSYRIGNDGSQSKSKAKAKTEKRGKRGHD